MQTLAAEAEEANKNAIKFTFFKFTIYVHIGFFIFSSLVFKENQVLNEECNPSKKIVIVEEELGDIDINGIRGFRGLNLEGLARIVFIDEECGNPKVVEWWWWKAF